MAKVEVIGKYMKNQYFVMFPNVKPTTKTYYIARFLYDSMTQPSELNQSLK